MSWSERAHSLLRQGYSEAEAYAIVAAERRGEKSGGGFGKPGSTDAGNSRLAQVHPEPACCCADDAEEAA